MGVLEGKVAIVTGSGQGIGRGIALAFAKEGAAVALFGRTFQKVARTAEEIKALGSRGLPIRCDVRRRSEVNDAVDQMVGFFGTVDILVNCAFSQAVASFEDISDEDMALHLQTSLLGTFHCMQACFPHMKKHGGKIINFGSHSGTTGMVVHGAYAAGKEAVRGLSRCAALDWGRYGINVNIICPNAMTPVMENWLTRQPPGTRELFEAAVPLRRMGDPEKDIGRAAVFLAGADSDFITGRTLFVDGGQGTFK